MAPVNILVVVDMLNDFCKKGGALYFPEGEAIIPAVAAKVKEFKDDNIIFLCDLHDENDKEFNRFPKHAVEGTDGADIVKEIDSLMWGDAECSDTSAIFINKTRYSGFYGTNLEDVLIWTRENNPKEDVEVTVVGVCTSICVMDTVGGLSNRDYSIIVPKNCVADFDQDAHAAALKRMEALYGAILSEE